MSADPTPLLLQPILMEKVWGGCRLARYGKTIPAGRLVGESWEVADLAATSAGGGGGTAARSIIQRGALAGATLHDALNTWGQDLLGDAPPSESGGFPLLVKFLDARENLSVQVHPSPRFSKLNTWAHLKTECWYIVEAEPGSVIYKGFKPGVGPADLVAAVRANTVVDLLNAVPAVAGECHFLPSGQCHALGAGVLVAEVQTPSDTTFRVYDWGRIGRELHVEEALECMSFDPCPAATRCADGPGIFPLVRNEYFDVDAVRAASEPMGAGDGCSVWMSITAQARVHSRAEGGAAMEIAPGSTIVVPAACAHATKIAAQPGGVLIRASLAPRE